MAKKPKMIRTIFWSLLSLLNCQKAMADILWMHNGDRLTGHIEEISDAEVSIVLPYSQTLTVRRDAIKRWHLNRQEKAKSQTKMETAQQNFSGDSHAWLWTGMADLNIKLKDSDKKNNNVNLKYSIELANLHWRYSLDGEYIYETSNSVTNNHEYKFSPKLDLFFDANWFQRTSIDYHYDMLNANYLNLNYASGAGYRFWNDKKRRLELITQLGLQRTYFPPNELYIEVFGEHIINYPAVILGWDYHQSIFLWQERFELFSKGNYEKFTNQPSLHLTRNQSVNGNLGIRYYFNDHLRLSWSSELTWEDISSFYYNGALWEPHGNKVWRHTITLGASF